MKRFIGVVVIGRNEGERLRKCLESVVGSSDSVVYVDSGSTDDSIAISRQIGAHVIKLDLATPFTAARARNEGFQKLQNLNPDLVYVQFVDGDCEVVGSWLRTAYAYLCENSDVAVVCGRRRERYPNASVYNMLCDIEWNTAIGDTKACGGDALIRAAAFKQVTGFNPGLIAGEEPELCLRLRQEGWRIKRMDEEMTLHDANMTRFSQWWQRNVRSGYAFALGEYLHGKKAEQHWVNEARRGRLWGGYIPLTILISTIINPLCFVFISIYLFQVFRIAIKSRHRINNNWKYSFFVTLGKFPEAQGQLRFYFDRLFGLRSNIIEYK